MTIPYRGKTGPGTYFVTSSCWEKKSLLQSDRMAALFVRVIQEYRTQQKFLLHAYVVMPDHFHLLVTPGEGMTLERCMQLVKGGFSFRAGREFQLKGSIWQSSFYDRRVRDIEEARAAIEYVHNNPVKRGLVMLASGYEFSSAHPAALIDALPQRLKPRS